MRTILTAPIFLIILLNACSKDDNVSNNLVRNEVGYLINQVIEDKDTTRFQYDNNNRLIGLSFSSGNLNFRGIYESFQYNSNGKIASYKYTYNGGTTLSNLHNFSYENDTIIETSVNLPTAINGDVTKFILSNDRIIETRTGIILNGNILLDGFGDTTHYFYQDDNLIKRSFRFLTSTYQPIDTFLYDKNFYNPYLLLGKHVWSLLHREFIYGQSKNIASNKTYSTYHVLGTTLISSGFSSFRMTAIESSQENPILPKVIKYLTDNGSEIITRFFYQRQK